MTEPLIFDVCCCEGGASRGYARAGFVPIGNDIFVKYTRARYPYRAIVGDAFAALDHLLNGGSFHFGSLAVTLKSFAAIHASFPCQKWSITNHDGRDYPDMISAGRDYLDATGLPYVMENVLGAPLRNPVELCGCMFNLTAVDTDGIKLHMWRPRQFENNFGLAQPEHGDLILRRSVLPVHDRAYHEYEWVGGCYGGARRDKYEAKYIREGGYVPADKRVVEEMMGIDWMTWGGLHQALPPVYTEYVGNELRKVL